MRQLGASKVEELRPDMVSINYCLHGNINKMLLTDPTGGLGTMETCEIVKESCSKLYAGGQIIVTLA